MENQTIQPLDALMTSLGLSNADLVKVSTEQLSFKNVQKGRKGRRLTPNIQAKILTALRSAKPGLNIRQRDLFHYPMNADTASAIQSAVQAIFTKKIRYPQFIDLLVEAGVIGYKTEVAAGRVTFFGQGGQAHVEEGPSVSQGPPGPYDEAAIREVISDAQKELIDHATFLNRVYAAGIVSYDVNCRSKKIEYQGLEESYKEKIASSTPEEKKSAPAVEIKLPAAAKKTAKPRKKNQKKSLTRKARMSSNKRFFQKKRQPRRAKTR